MNKLAKVIERKAENGVTLHKVLFVGYVTGSTSTGLFVARHKNESRTEASEWFPFESKAGAYVRLI